MVKALLAKYGASDAAMLDVLFGKANPEGRLPIELPSSYGSGAKAEGRCSF